MMTATTYTAKRFERRDWCVGGSQHAINPMPVEALV